MTDADGIDHPPYFTERERREQERLRNQRMGSTTTVRTTTATVRRGNQEEQRRFNGSLADWIISTDQFKHLSEQAYQDVREEEHQLYGTDPSSEPSRDAAERLWTEAQARVVRGLIQDLVRYI